MAQPQGKKVRIIESTERFSEVRLRDGTTLAVKPNVLEVVRVDDKWDQEGNPVYIVRSQNIILPVEVPPDLKKPPKGD